MSTAHVTFEISWGAWPNMTFMGTELGEGTSPCGLVIYKNGFSSCIAKLYCYIGRFTWQFLCHWGFHTFPCPFLSRWKATLDPASPSLRPFSHYKGWAISVGSALWPPQPHGKNSPVAGHLVFGCPRPPRRHQRLKPQTHHELKRPAGYSPTARAPVAMKVCFMRMVCAPGIGCIGFPSYSALK